MVLPACSQIPKGASKATFSSPHVVLVLRLFPTGVKMWRPLSATEETRLRGGIWNPRHRKLHVDIMDDAF